MMSSTPTTTTLVNVPVHSVGGAVVANVAVEVGPNSSGGASARDVRLRLAERLGVSASLLGLLRGSSSVELLDDDDAVLLGKDEHEEQHEEQQQQHLILVRITPLRCATASSQNDNAIRIWCSVTGECLLTLAGHLRPASSVAFSSDGRHVLTGSWDGTAKLWCAETGLCLLTLEGHEVGLPIRSAAISATRALTGSWDHTAKVWCLDSGRSLLTLRGHLGAVTSVAFFKWSLPAIAALTGSCDGTAKLWCTETGVCLLSFEEANCDVVLAVASSSRASAVSFLAAERGGAAIVVYSSDVLSPDRPSAAHVKAVSLHGAMLQSPLPRHVFSADFSRCAFSKNASRVAMVFWFDQAKIWCAETGICLFALDEKTRGLPRAHIMGPLAFSPDGDRILMGAVLVGTATKNGEDDGKEGGPSSCLLVLNFGGGVTAVAFEDP